MEWKVRDWFGFQLMGVPVTFLRIGSSSVRRLGTSYRLVRVVLVKKGLEGEKWKWSSKPSPSGKSMQVMSVRWSRQSTSASVINSATTSTWPIAHAQNCGMPLTCCSPPSSSSSSLTSSTTPSSATSSVSSSSFFFSSKIAPSNFPLTTSLLSSYNGFILALNSNSNAALSTRYSSIISSRLSLSDLSLSMRGSMHGGRRERNSLSSSAAPASSRLAGRLMGSCCATAGGGGGTGEDAASLSSLEGVSSVVTAMDEKALVIDSELSPSVAFAFASSSMDTADGSCAFFSASKAEVVVVGSTASVMVMVMVMVGSLGR
mmetsp:Transcript_15981/g.28982  ORF Transcript_15981/g.28982 Transcript_15981/m.28982 type:complete len:317 (+) Transcript_15981:628-1578(+)